MVNLFLGSAVIKQAVNKFSLLLFRTVTRAFMTRFGFLLSAILIYATYTRPFLDMTIKYI